MIAQSKHTQGRWQAIPANDRLHRWLVIQADSPGRGKTVLAEKIRTEANARLFAASPKLLKALDYLLEQTVDMDLKYGIILSEGEEDARKEALQAIAEATGEVA